MRKEFYLLIAISAVAGFFSITAAAQTTKKGLVVNGEDLRSAIPKQQVPVKTEQPKQENNSADSEQPARSDEKQTVPQTPQNVAPIQFTPEETSLLNNKPLTRKNKTTTENKIPGRSDSSLQINGKQNKYGSDDIDDSDLATLKDLEINNTASFFVNGSDGSLKETEAPKESELALVAGDEALSKKTPNAAVNMQVASSDLVSIAAGKVSPRMKKIVTTTTYTTVILPGGNMPAVNPGKLLGTSRGISGQIAQWIMIYGRQYGVDPLLILEVMRQESQFKPFAQSPVGAAGLMQFMPATAARFGINPLDPEQAIRGGAMYLSFLLRRYGGNVYSALAGYNAGEGAVDCFLTGRSLRLSNGKIINRSGMRTMHGIPPYTETQNYVKVITSRYFAARQSFGN